MMLIHLGADIRQRHRLRDCHWTIGGHGHGNLGQLRKILPRCDV